MGKAVKAKTRDSIEDRMLKAVAKYLETKDWHVAVVSAARIQGPVSAGLNYEFVLRFSGKKKEPTAESALKQVEQVGESIHAIKSAARKHGFL